MVFIIPYSMERGVLLGKGTETLSTETTTEREPDLIPGYLDRVTATFHKANPDNWACSGERIELSSVLRDSLMGSGFVNQGIPPPYSSDSLRLRGLSSFLKIVGWEFKGLYDWFFSLTPKQQATLKSFIDSLAEKESDVTTVLPDSLSARDLDLKA